MKKINLETLKKGDYINFIIKYKDESKKSYGEVIHKELWFDKVNGMSAAIMVKNADDKYFLVYDAQYNGGYPFTDLLNINCQ